MKALIFAAFHQKINDVSFLHFQSFHVDPFRMIRDSVLCFTSQCHPVIVSQTQTRNHWESQFEAIRSVSVHGTINNPAIPDLIPLKINAIRIPGCYHLTGFTHHVIYHGRSQVSRCFDGRSIMSKPCDTHAKNNLNLT